MKSKILIVVLCLMSTAAIAESRGTKSNSHNSTSNTSGISKSYAMRDARNATVSVAASPSIPSGLPIIRQNGNYGRDPCLSNYKCRAKFY